jgi:hypothetical protein
VGGYPPTARGDHFSYQAIVFYIRLRANDLFGPDRLYNAIAAIFSVEFDFSGRHNPILAEFQNGCRNNNTTTDRARVEIL